MPERCVAFDLEIETDLAITGALAAADKPRDLDARIRWRAPECCTAAAPVWAADGDTVCFTSEGVARYRCTRREIEITPMDGAAADDVDALLIATALPVMLWLRGAFVLHAAVVRPSGGTGALAISGRSGLGKSTLASEFLARGATLVADDSVAIHMDGGLTCAGLPGGYHLGGKSPGERSFNRLPDRRSIRSARLDAVAILGDDPREIRPRRLAGLEALTALLINRHRPRASLIGGFEPRVLADAALLAKSLPVYIWPRGAAKALLDGHILTTIMNGGGIDGYDAVAAQ